jgi:hypothetical protein
MKQGKVTIPPGAHPALHEIEAANILAAQGKNIEFLVPSRTKGMKTPDLQMDGILWEMKSPIGKGKNTIQRTLKRAVAQSHNAIIDLRRTGLHQDAAIAETKRQITLNKSIKRILIITKSHKILDRVSLTR